ncbi:MAG: pyridoxamine 5'-phosphate oxidase family protein [Tissierellia bacterium]|nr:pyridoxamine 5'-phosphate oxidase family protein [Tissierellia bacterium]
MAKVTDAMKEFMTDHLAYIATVDEDGNPNIGPKRSARLLDDNHIIFNENTGGQTMRNILNNGKVAVAYVDWPKLLGYRFVGRAEVFEDGEYFEECCQWAKGKMGAPKAAVVITIERIFNLQSGGNAGKEIFDEK